MRSWNTHAWYVTGILVALLIGTVSVQWSGITNLPEIIGFALGLASLLLAIIAIIQTLTASGNVEAALGAVRSVADDLKAGSSSLADVAADIKAFSSQMSESSTTTSSTLLEIKQELQANSSQKQSAPAGQPASTPDLMGPAITYGGTIAIYALAHSMKVQKRFQFSEIFEGKEGAPPAPYLTAYAAALRAFGNVEIDFNKAGYQPINLRGQEDRIIEETKSIKFKNIEPARFAKSLAIIDEYFCLSEDT